MDNAVDDLTTRSDRTTRWFGGPRVGHWRDSHHRVGRPAASWTNHDPATVRSALLDCYLQGWAEANPLKIILVTDPDYQLNDPLIGLFSRAFLPRYFEMLRRKFAVAGVTRQRELAFFLRGPVDGASSERVCQFYRDAPELGLTGIATITVGNRGVSAEKVAYDSNLALDVLTRVLPNEDTDMPPVPSITSKIAART